MTSGIPVTRGWVFVLKTGEVVIDWADGRVQDIMTGDFMSYDEKDYGRPVQDTDLEMLRNNGRVDAYNARTVYLRPLPEPPRATID
ncbi:MAG: hypothetical protein MUO35_14495 [Anaerolineales bacterium]|jgi:hypothetical protein|nr:hypothetical protein [Anaerolineales bacterium]